MASGTAGGRIAPGVGANLIGQHAQDRNQDATVYVGNLDSQMSEELVWELFMQAGPVVNIYLPKDRVTNQHQGYGFVEFRSEEDADYAIKIINMIKVYSKPIRVNKASQDKKSLDVGANLFIGNLDPDVDEKLLYDTFSAFGMIVATPKIMRDPETGTSRGFGFVSYDSFEASDAAIDAMNGQFLCNRPISVSYAFKKDTKGERHGTPAERLLAEQQRSKAASLSRPNTLFATGPKQQPEQRPAVVEAAPPPPPEAMPPPPPPAPAGGPDGTFPPPAPPLPMQAPPPPASGGPPPWMQQAPRGGLQGGPGGPFPPQPTGQGPFMQPPGFGQQQRPPMQHGGPLGAPPPQQGTGGPGAFRPPPPGYSGPPLPFRPPVGPQQPGGGGGGPGFAGQQGPGFRPQGMPAPPRPGQNLPPGAPPPPWAGGPAQNAGPQPPRGMAGPPWQGGPRPEWRPVLPPPSMHPN